MTITRDTWLFYLALAGTLLAYLATSDNTPDQWTFKQWVQFALVGVTWLIGKMQHSPLPGSKDPEVKKARKEGDVVL